MKIHAMPVDACSDVANPGLGAHNNDQAPQLIQTFKLLPGESVQAIVKCTEGDLTLSNYRLVLQFNLGTYCIPLGVIEQTEIKRVVCLYILCKDARWYKCTFPTSEQCQEWQKKITETAASSIKFDRVFACSFYFATLDIPSLHSFFVNQVNGTSYFQQSNKNFQDEFERLGFNNGSAWRISLVNENYKLCDSYPRKLIVPSSISDQSLEEISTFRTSRRIPSVVWRHPNGAVIARSSQPEVGLLWWRSTADESLVKAISEACAYGKSSPEKSRDSQLENGSRKTDLNDSSNSDISSICDLPEAKSQKDIKKLFIMDARSYTTTVANRARGGGCECEDYYPQSEIQFMSLDNIHTIRKSHQSLRSFLLLSPDIPNWLSSLENTRWLYHISGLIKAAVIVAQTIAMEQPVLVHCTDGWDRTPQIISIAEILLDPYYRTIEGFQVMVEREWVEFGHKFGHRCVGTTADVNEMCPVFLQWLDCVHQIVNQFPTLFQYNQAFLVKLAQHTYSNLFGTFFFDSAQDRFRNEEKHGRNMFTVWPLFKLHLHRYTNHLYLHSSRIISPSSDCKDLVLWKAVYVNEMGSNQDERFATAADTPRKGKVTEAPIEGDLIKTKSCDNLLQLSLSHVPRLPRTSSDPSLRDSLPDLALLKSALGSEVFEEKAKVCPTQFQMEKEALRKSSCEVNKILKPLSSPPISDNSKASLKVASVAAAAAEDEKNREICIDKNILVTVSAKRSMEGSTDTLVSENVSVMSDEAGPSHKGCFAKSTKHCSNGATKSNEEGLKKIGCKSMPVRNLFSDDRVHDTCSTGSSYISSSVDNCNICLKKKKKLSEASESENGKTDDAHACSHSIPVFNYTPATSPAISSTPNEEFSDGLTNYKDDITVRLNQMKFQHQMEVESLKKELQATKNYYVHMIHIINHATDNHTEDQVSLPESVGSGSNDSVGQESSGLSDASWEALEEGESRTTLWVPDHAVDSCLGCHMPFWIGRRKHHCRNCGKIFCSECSENSAPIPKENLFNPVRVCSSCFSSLPEFRPKYVQVASH